MDRTGKKKVTVYVLISVVFLILCGLLFYETAKKQYETQLAWMVEFTQEHPEAETKIASLWKEQKPKSKKELQSFRKPYGYTFYNTAQGKALLLQMLGTAICGLGAIWFCYVFSKKKEEHLRQEMERLQALEEKVREKDAYILDLKEAAEKEEENTKALITNISHQLKTPLAGLKLMQELCEEEPDEQELREYFRRSGESVTKLTELTEELMQLSKLENHMIRLHPKQQNLKKLTVGAVDEIILKAIQKKMEIQVDEGDSFQCHCDEKWTREALVNILDNAVKYSSEKSCITIRIFRMHSYGLIEIEDEGIGIKPEEYHKIFGRFYRGKGKEVESQEGAGVGLYLTRKIIEEQGGTVSVKASPKGGSIFRVTLPLE